MLLLLSWKKNSKRLTLPNKLCVANYSFSSELCVSQE